MSGTALLGATLAGEETRQDALGLLRSSGRELVWLTASVADVLDLDAEQAVELEGPLRVATLQATRAAYRFLQNVALDPEASLLLRSTIDSTIRSFNEVNDWLSLPLEEDWHELAPTAVRALTRCVSRLGLFLDRLEPAREL
jgi:hypothetical protein